jgi:hypothetical protein
MHTSEISPLDWELGLYGVGTPPQKKIRAKVLKNKDLTPKYS